MSSWARGVRRLGSDERGSSAVELGMLLPVLLVLLTLAAPLVKAGWEYVVLDRAVASGVRYAARADTNPRNSASGLTRRPSAAEVEEFVRQASAGLSVDSVSVSPEPSGALPGEPITVTARYSISFATVADAANAIKGVLFGPGEVLPPSISVTVASKGREE